MVSATCSLHVYTAKPKHPVDRFGFDSHTLIYIYLGKSGITKLYHQRCTGAERQAAILPIFAPGLFFFGSA